MNVLVLSGGGQAGWDILGAIDEIESEYTFTAYVGTSVGGIIAMLCSVGFRAVEVFEKLQNVDISNKPSIVRCVEEFGFCDMQHIMAAVQTILEDRCGPNPTFKSCKKKFEKDLVITGVCLSTNRTEYFSWNTHPDMKIMDAIRITCAVPILFVPVWYENRLYLDGGLGDNFPINYAKRTYKNAEHVVGVSIRSSRCEPKCIFTYMVNVVQFLIDRHQSIVPETDEEGKLTIIQLEQDITHMLDLFRNVENKNELFHKGKDMAKMHLRSSYPKLSNDVE